MKQRRFSNSFVALTLLLVGVVVVGAACRRSNTLAPPNPVTLTIWRSEDQPADFEQLTEQYTAQYPYVTFAFKTLTGDEYEDALFSAWSKGEGPDIFSVPNMRLGKFREFISPMPAEVKLKTVSTVTKLGRKQQVVEENTRTLPVASVIRNDFVDVVASDVVANDQVYGLPLSMDTMVLYYNRDIMNRAGVAVPPTTWEEFRDAVQSMVVLDNERAVVQPAAALGAAENVPHFFDLLSVLMMQNGTVMEQNSRATFAGETEDKRFPAIESVDFYRKFSDSTYATYTWNDQQPDALELFTQGNLGFFFGYYSDLAIIEQRAPNLNFSYAPLPQIDPSVPVNVAQYPVEAVHVTSPAADHAWNFLAFASSADGVPTFLEATGRVSAVRSLVSATQNDPETGVFARQSLTAKSWYHGVDPDTATDAFANMITDAVAQSGKLEDVVARAQSTVSLTYKQE